MVENTRLNSVRDVNQSNPNIWLGITDENSNDGDWVDTDGTALTYTRWGADGTGHLFQRNQGDDPEIYGYIQNDISSTGYWNDAVASYETPFVCTFTVPDSSCFEYHH